MVIKASNKSPESFCSHLLFIWPHLQSVMHSLLMRSKSNLMLIFVNFNYSFWGRFTWCRRCFHLILWICKCSSNLLREVGISVEHTQDRSILPDLLPLFFSRTTPSILFCWALYTDCLFLIVAWWLAIKTQYPCDVNRGRLGVKAVTVLSQNPLQPWKIQELISTLFSSISSFFFLPVLYITLLSCALFFSGPTSSEAITLAAARQWPEISKEPGQAASTAGKAAPCLISLSPSIIHAPPKRRFHECVWFVNAIVALATGILKLDKPFPWRFSIIWKQQTQNAGPSTLLGYKYNNNCNKTGQ